VSEHLDTHLNALGDDMQRRKQKNYFAYRRIRNFACEALEGCLVVEAAVGWAAI
jgi:predicted transport protein